MGEAFRVACVTGGAGFIGSHLVRALLGRGMDVRVLDNLSVGRRDNVPKDAVLIEGDITDEASARRAIAGSDVVFHLAARVAIRSSFEFAFEDATTNVAGTARILRAVEDARTPRKVIVASSMAVYADADRPVPITEDHPTAPISPYGVTKLAVERLTHVMCARIGVPSVALRLFNTYGPGQALSPYVGVVTIFIDALTRGERPTIFGDGEQRRDFVHVEDVARGFVNAMDAPVVRGTYNIASGHGLTVNDVFSSVQQALGTDLEPRRADAVSGEVRFSVADISRAERDLAYRPVRHFSSSIHDVVHEVARR
jgi:nucleoside-diphosphate-sugar epimerase